MISIRSEKFSGIMAPYQDCQDFLEVLLKTVLEQPNTIPQDVTIISVTGPDAQVESLQTHMLLWD